MFTKRILDHENVHPPPISAHLAGLTPERTEKSTASVFDSVVDVAYRLAVQTGESIENRAVTRQAVHEGILQGSHTDHRNQAFVSPCIKH